MQTIPLAALQHYAFCPRQCALIHNEQAWAENYLTAQGRSLHERVDSGEPETRKGVRFERGVHVSAQQLGISGIIDMVEHDLASGRLKPVEYKRGKPKPEPFDEIQLCAQGFIDELLRTNAYTAKGFAIEGLDGLKMVPRSVIENYGKEVLKGEIETTVFSKFALEKTVVSISPFSTSLP